MKMDEENAKSGGGSFHYQNSNHSKTNKNHTVGYSISIVNGANYLIIKFSFQRNSLS